VWSWNLTICSKCSIINLIICIWESCVGFPLSISFMWFCSHFALNNVMHACYVLFVGELKSKYMNHNKCNDQIKMSGKNWNRKYLVKTSKVIVHFVVSHVILWRIKALPTKKKKQNKDACMSYRVIQYCFDCIKEIVCDLKPFFAFLFTPSTW